jgi:hypothetical protein
MDKTALRTCNICAETKPLTEYYFNNRGYPHGKCKSCYIKIKQKDYTPEKGRDKNLRHKYGITLEEYNNLLEKQDNKCAICLSTDPAGRKSGRGGSANVFVVDHCHKTEKVRGILCHRCNRSMGVIGDNINTLQEMIKYLQKHQTL